MKTKRKYVALLAICAMLICTFFCTNTAMADTEALDVVETHTCIIDGVERTLTVYSDDTVYFTIGSDKSFDLISKGLGIGFGSVPKFV